LFSNKVLFFSYVDEFIDYLEAEHYLRSRHLSFSYVKYFKILTLITAFIINFIIIYYYEKLFFPPKENE